VQGLDVIRARAMLNKMANSTEFAIVRAMQKPLSLRRGILCISRDSATNVEIHNSRQKEDRHDVPVRSLFVPIR